MLGRHVAQGVDAALLEANAKDGAPALAPRRGERERERARRVRFACLELLRDLAPARNRNAGAPADDIRGGEAGQPGCAVVPVLDDVVVVDQHDRLGDVVERAGGVGEPLRLSEEEGVVDGCCGAPRELERKLEVDLGVLPLRHRSDQGESSDGAAARGNLTPPH